MSLPYSLQRAAQNTAQTLPLMRDPALVKPGTKAQLRRYEVTSLLPNGNIVDTRHFAPALPLFEQAFTAFTRGTLVETNCGPVAIEDLFPGDQILASDGSCRTLLWKGMTTMLPGRSSASGSPMSLTSFMPDSLGLQRPMSCVVAGPAARVLSTPAHMRHLEGESRLLTPAQEFLDGMYIVETAPPSPVDLYHLCLDQHAAIRIGGLEFESYHPGDDALNLVSYPIKTLFLNMFGHVNSLADFGPLAFDRARLHQA